MNLTMSLVDCKPFLGEYEVRPLAGNVGFLDFELGMDLFREVIERVPIRNAKRCYVESFRSKGLDIMNEFQAEFLIKWLKDRTIEALIFDPFSRIYRGDGDNNTEVLRFLKQVNLIKEESGVVDFFMPVHSSSRSSTRGQSRGASTLDDFPDNRWLVGKDKPEVDAQRTFAATARGALWTASRPLQLDPATNSLHLGPASLMTPTPSPKAKAKASKDSEEKQKILTALAVKDNVNYTELAKTTGIDRRRITRLVNDLSNEGKLFLEDSEVDGQPVRINLGQDMWGS
jgi:hypothetical protein